MKTVHRLAVSVAIALSGVAYADTPRALPVGMLPDDGRLGALRTLNDYFPFTPVASKEAWADRSAKLQRQVLVATGLWPMPERTPLNAVVHGKVEREDYTVEKVIFESVPGHFVTGNLYRPIGKSGKRPAVLSPHGHWPNGRFQDTGEEEARKQISVGAERFEVGGRHPLQARAVQLARMGCVVFFYDMEGYADSVQLADENGAPHHRPGVRERMNTPENWGLFSPQAELRLQTSMGIQAWNSVRALDFIASLPDVDTSKIAITGASGGGTQSFLLAGTDDRIAVSVPVVMVSTAMQGGCTCENASYLRIGAGNVDLAGLTAPRPQAMISANDWTSQFMTKGYPDIQNLYKMLGEPNHVHAESFTQFGHNDNAVSRGAMYAFIDKQFGLDFHEPRRERDFVPLTIEEASVWDATHPRPAGERIGEPHERAMLKGMTDASNAAMEKLAPKDAASLAEFKRVVGGAWDTIIGRRIEDVGKVSFELKDKSDRGTYLQMTGLVTREGQPPSPLFTDANKHGREQLPVLFLHPKDNWNGQVVIWVDDAGKSSLLDDAGKPKPAVAKLLDAKFSVLAADLIGQGEFTPNDKPVTAQRITISGKGDEPWNHAAAYTFGYNRPLFAHRVHDVLTLIRFVQTDEHKAKQIHLVGFGETGGPVAAAARAQSGDAIAKAAIDTSGFRFASLTQFADPMFVPGAVKYGDVPALLALNAPGKLWVAGESPDASSIKQAYTASNQPGAVTAGDGTPDAPIAWLIGS